MSSATLPAIPNGQGTPSTITARIDHNAVLKAVGLNLSDPNAQALLLTCERYGLDPILKHMVLIQGRPYVTRDGLLHVAHCSGQFDGIEVKEQGETQTHFTATVSVYRKDMSRPFTYIGRYPKNGGNKSYGPEMAVKCGEVMAFRRAFNVGLCAREELWDRDQAQDHQEPIDVEVEAHREVNESFPQQPRGRRDEPKSPPRDDAPSEPMPGKRPAAETWASFAARTVAEVNLAWRNEMAIEGVDQEKRVDLVNQYQLVNRVCTRAIEAGLIDEAAISKDGKPGARDQQKALKAASDLYARTPGKVRSTVGVYVLEKTREMRATLGMFDPDAPEAGDATGQEGVEDASQEMVETAGREAGSDDDRE